jgi:hypothetical protein
MPTVLTPEELKARFTGIKKNLIYDEAVVIHNKLRVHADGEIPILLIKNARPNESEQVRDYREKIYEAETQNPVERVIGLLEKIRRSPDWQIRFDEEVPPIINSEETPAKYLTEKYPVYGDIEYWLFEELLRNLALDANGVVAIIPKDFKPMADNEYMQPVACIFNCKNVIEFIPNDIAVLKSDDLSSLLSPEMQQQRILAARSIRSMANGVDYFIAGQVYYVITTSVYQKWEENSDSKYQLTEQIPHGLNALPVFQMPGKFVKRVGSYMLKKTPLYPMVPHLNKAARESNDLDAGVIMHLYLEKWRINNVPCKTCNGSGKIASEGGPSPCKTCDGTGFANGKSPFNEIVVKAASIGEQNVPIPPLGYVEKNPEILKVQNERIKDHLYKALASVNMEHLGETPLSQSGVAKQYDRDEVNNLIYTFAGAICNVANRAIYFINELRYSNLVPDAEKRKKLLPIIPVPEKFDVVNTTFLIGEYATGKTAGLNAIILSEMQKEIASKKFYANPEVAAYVQTVMDLDPFPDKTIEEKAMMESQGLATKNDIIMSNYISDFVRLAMEDDPDFASKKDAQKREVLDKYAAEKVAELSTSTQLMQDIIPGNPAPDPNNPTVK